MLVAGKDGISCFSLAGSRVFAMGYALLRDQRMYYSTHPAFHQIHKNLILERSNTDLLLHALWESDIALRHIYNSCHNMQARGSYHRLRSNGQTINLRQYEYESRKRGLLNWNLEER